MVTRRLGLIFLLGCCDKILDRNNKGGKVHGFRNSSPSQRERHGGVGEGMVGCMSFGMWRMLTS